MNKIITLERREKEDDSGSLCKGCIFNNITGFCSVRHVKELDCIIEGKNYIWKITSSVEGK
jgi:hypothetical protein